MQNALLSSLSRPSLPATLPDFVQRRVDRFYTERVAESWGGRHILRGRQPAEDALLLNNNDYLAITRHPRIVQAQTAALAAHGNGAMMSGLFLQQDDDPMHRLEAKFAGALGFEASVLCQSGFNANVGLVQAIAGERTPVYIDLIAHTSLWEGIKSAGAQAVPILHNDTDYLERQILRHGPGVVLVDSVYSTNGSLCLLQEFVEVAEQNGCVIVVDESHSLGTHGRQGEGLVASMGLSNRVHFVTASLAKAYCSRAGLIACDKRFAQYFGFESLPAIFSSTLLPHEIAALDAAHEVIRNEGWRRDRLHAVTRRLRQALAELNYPIADGSEQIIALEAGTEANTMRLRDALESHGVFGAIFCAPATAKNRALVRLTLHADLSDADVERIIEACRQVREIIDVSQWAASRRQQRVPARRTAPLLEAVA